MRRCALILIALCLLVSPAWAANIYVRSTDGDNADNGSTWALAKADLAGAAAIDAAGDTIYVSDNHAENTSGAAIALAWAGTAASPTRVLCVDDSAEPPTAVATTGTVTTSGSGGPQISISGHVYIYGLSFESGNGGTGTSASILLNSGGVAASAVAENCTFKVSGTATANRINLGALGSSPDEQRTELINCNVLFAHASQGVSPQGRVIWRGGTAAASGTVPTTLFLPAANCPFHCEASGLNLSTIDSGKSLVNVGTASTPGFIRLSNCRLGSSVALTTGSFVGPGGVLAMLANCDSGDTNTRYEKACYEGNIYSETTIVRTGGATDGTTAVSRKMVSSANSKFYTPLVSDPIYAWNETTGSNVTVTVETVTDNVTLTDAEAWVEVEYLGTSGFPLASTASDRAADILATPANQTTSTETWTTTGLTTPVKQKLAVTFTPQEKGMLVVRVCLAKASTTMYFCPKVIDNADGKELMVMSPSYLNQYDVADPPPASDGNFLPLLSLAPERTWEGVDRNPRYSPFAILGALAP